MTIRAPNVDSTVVAGFGDEWTRFDQSELSLGELKLLWDRYFDIFPWKAIPRDAFGFDLGCGTGRWARLVAPRVGRLVCIDASADALAVAKRTLAPLANVEFCHASVDSVPYSDGTFDFGYSLGVLHHVPDTQMGLNAAVQKLKHGAPFLLYLYYAFDNRTPLFRATWRLSELIRAIVSRSPMRIRYLLSQIFAALLYWPLARTASVLEALGTSVESIPLSAYRHLSFYTMRTDALDRFGTRLEQRFTRAQMQQMMENAGLGAIVFRESPNYWTAVGFRTS